MYSEAVSNIATRNLNPSLFWKATWGFPGGSIGKESTCTAGNAASILGAGRSPGIGNGNPLQYFCLGSPMDRGAWWAAVHGITRDGQDWATKQHSKAWGWLHGSCCWGFFRFLIFVCFLIFKEALTQVLEMFYILMEEMVTWLDIFFRIIKWYP